MDAIRRHPLVWFWILAFTISWASFYALGGPTVFTLGPLFAAIIMSIVMTGVDGLRELIGRVFKWRVPPVWYAAALLAPIGIGIAVVGVTALLGFRLDFARLGPWYQPFLIFGILLITGDTLFEETGWRGYAMPRFSKTRPALANTLLLGVLLAAWHLPVAISEGSAITPYLIATIASAVVTNWVYFGGRESALLAWLYHTSANTIGQLVGPLYPPAGRVTYFWALAGVNLLAAVIVIAATGTDLQGARTAGVGPGRVPSH